MPWSVKRTEQCPTSRPWGVLDADGKVIDGGCHTAHDMANRHMAALYANEPTKEARAALVAAAAPFLIGLPPRLREQGRDHLGRFAGGSGGGGGGSAGAPGGGSVGGAPGGHDVAGLFTRAEAGGFTYSPATHKYAVKGFAVSPYPKRSRVIPFKDATPATIAKYQRDNADLLSKPGHHLGAWREKDGDTDRLWLDVTVVASDRAAGARLGRAHDQISMYDLGSGRTIDLGGTGGHARATRRMAGRARDELIAAAAPFLILPHLLREQSRDHLGRFGHGSGGPDPASMHTVAAIRATYDYTDPVTGMRAVVTRPNGDGDPQRSTYVYVNILDRHGNLVGTAERTIHASGQASVLHGGIALNGDVQGQGFATRWNQQVESGYRANGIKQIHLHASGGGMNGSYTWARAGYEFGDAGSRGDVARHFEVAAGAQRFHRGGPEIHAAVTKLAADPHASPIDFAMVGWQPGATTWFGKETLLQVSWEGVKTL